MKIYRVTQRTDGGEHDGYVYLSDKSKATTLQKRLNKEADAKDEVEPIEFTPTKSGIIDMLNLECAYPNNG